VVVTLDDPAILDSTTWVSHVNFKATPIVELVDEHLLSCIKMIERGRDANGIAVPSWARVKASALVEEADRRGILGQYKCDKQVMDGWDA
jgi:hypothetical protein